MFQFYSAGALSESESECQQDLLYFNMQHFCCQSGDDLEYQFINFFLLCLELFSSGFSFFMDFPFKKIFGRPENNMEIFTHNSGTAQLPGKFSNGHKLRHQSRCRIPQLRLMDGFAETVQGNERKKVFPVAPGTHSLALDY